jgi:hypothetical protein
MAFDKNEYKSILNKKIEERYTIREVGPGDVSQGDLGLGEPAPQASTQPQATQQPQTPTNPNAAPKAKDPEISMEVLRGTVQWALNEKDSGKSTDEIVNQLGAMKKPGLIDFIHSYLQGSGQQAPTASPEVSQSAGEPGADDLSGLTNPEPAADPNAAPPADPNAAPAPDAAPTEPTDNAL